MKVSYNVSFISMEVVSFVSEGDKAKEARYRALRSQLRGDFLLRRDQAEWERMPVSRGTKEWDLSDRGARK